MIINNNKEILDYSGDEFATFQSKVNKSKLAKLYGLLSNIYKNPIGAIVREYASNAYDANKEAYNFATMDYDSIIKNYTWMVDPSKEDINISRDEFNEIQSKLKRTDEKEPVVVGFYKQGDETYFYIKDYGVGLSPKRMMFIYFDYLSSTKEDNNEEIGGFGIGAKSALAYTDVFEIDTNYNGVNYKYIMSRGPKGIPEGNLLYKSEFDESIENGTTIKVKLKSEADLMSFYSEIKVQLAYMDNLYVDEEYLHSKSYFIQEELNNYKIYSVENWLIKSRNEPLSEMHICLGNITYSIDWNELDIRPINVPIALKFEIGELEPTPSRESIVYEKKTRDILLDRIQAVRDYYTGYYKKSISNPDTLDDFISLRKKNRNILEFENEFDDGYIIDMSDLMPDNKYKVKLEYPPFKDLMAVPGDLFEGYHCRRKISYHTGKVEVYKYNIMNIDFNSRHSDRTFIFMEERGIEIDPIHSKYIIEEVSKYRDVYIFEPIKGFNYDNYLSRYLYNSGEEFNFAKAFYIREINSFLKSKSLDYKNHIPDPNWYHKYYAGKSRFSIIKKKRIEGTISSLSTTNGRYFHRESINLRKYKFHNKLVVFCKNEDKKELGYIVEALTATKSLDGYGAVVGMCVAKTNYEILKKMENTVALEDAFTEIRTFRRIVTSARIENEMFDLFDKCKWILDVNDDLKLAYTSVVEYLRQNNSGNYLTTQLMDELKLIAEKNGYYDSSIIADFNFVKEYMSGLELLNYIDTDALRKESKELESEGKAFKTHLAFLDYVKLKGKRISNHYYLKKDESIQQESEEVPELQGD